MRQGVFIIFLLTTICGANSSMAQSFNEIDNKINHAIQAGSIEQLSPYLNTTIELCIPGKEGSFSKTQSRVIIQSFFKKYPPNSYSIKNQGTSSDGSNFSIGEYLSGNTIFRTYFVTKKSNEKILLFQLHFEKK